MITALNHAKIPTIQLKQQLYTHKQQIINKQNLIKQKIATQYHQLIQHLQNKQQKIKNQISSSAQHYYHEVDENIRSMNNQQEIVYGGQLNYLIQLLNTVYCENNKIQNLDKIDQFVYNVKLTSQVSKKQVQIATNKKQCNRNEKNILSSEIIIEKLEQQIEHIMLRQNKLKKEIQNYQQKLTKKGCFKENKYNESNEQSGLKFERIKAENAILVAEIAETSQKLMQANSENYIFKKQLKNFFTVENKKLLNSTDKITDQTILNTSHIQSCLKQLISELQEKNQKFESEFKIMQVQLEKNKIQFQALQIQLNEKKDEIKKLLISNEQLQIDYQLSCKKKQKIEQENIKIRNNQQNIQYNKKIKNQQIQQHIKDLNVLIKNQNQKICGFKSIIIQFQNQKINYIKELNYNKLSLQQVNDKIYELTNQHQILLKDNEIKLNAERQIYDKKLKDIQQINNKNINQKYCNLKQIQYLKEQIQKERQEVRKLQIQLKKNEVLKKQTITLKKQLKNLKKSIQEIQKELKDKFDIKFSLMIERIQVLKDETLKEKNLMDKKYQIMQSRLSIMKNKFQHQLVEIVMQKQQKLQKKSLIEIVQKYTNALQYQAQKKSQIKQFKDEINELKNKKNTNDILQVQQKQIFCQKSILFLEQRNIKQIKHLEIQILQETINQMKESIQRQKIMKEQISKQFIEQNKKVLEMHQKIQKGQNNKSKEIENTQFKLSTTQDKLKKIQTELKSNKTVLKKVQIHSNDLQVQLRTKKQFINCLKNQIKDKDNTILSLKEKISTINQELDRVKKFIKDCQKKEAMFRQMKDKIQGYKEIELQYQNLKKTVEEKQKMHKYELIKKETELKDLRQLGVLEGNKIQQQQYLSMQQKIGEQKQKMKKLRGELDRKQSLYNHQKQKLQKIILQYEQEIMRKDKKLSELTEQLQIINKKIQFTKIGLKKEQSKAYLLVTTIKKLYQIMLTACINKSQIISSQKNLSVGTKPSSGTISKLNGKSRYLQGLEILQLSENDLVLQQNFDENQISYNSLSFSSPIQKKKKFGEINLTKNMKNIESILSQTDINMQQIIKQFEIFIGQNL